MKNKNQLPATILLVLGGIVTAGGIFLFINRFAPMWSFSHKYMTDSAIFVMLGIRGAFIGVITLLLARSLCEPAHLYLWDEPLNYIDLLSRGQIEDLLLESRPTILFVEHDKRFCERIATGEVRLRRTEEQP